MKMLALAIILISVPWISHAKSWEHFNHDNHHQSRYDKFSFWHDVERRRHKQHRHISRGVEKGLLTRREVRELKREQKHVTRQIKHLKRHRYISRSDKRSVLRHLDDYSDQIRHLKQNNRNVYKDRHHYNAYSHHRNKNYYRKDRRLSWANNDYSAGFYFRF